jgi:hypothetical protein
MLLSELKNAVDDGKTAKHLRWRSILHWFVKKELGFYAKQAEGYVNGDGFVVVRSETAFYPTWEMLVGSFEKYYAESSSWRITDDPLEDYLPPERKMMPEADEQTPS